MVHGVDRNAFKEINLYGSIKILVVRSFGTQREARYQIFGDLLSVSGIKPEMPRFSIVVRCVLYEIVDSHLT